MVNTIVINIQKEDLKTIKRGIDALYEVLSCYMGETYNKEHEWMYDLYSFMFEKLKFDDIK